MKHLEQAFLAYTAREGGEVYRRGSTIQGTYCYTTFPITTSLQPQDTLRGGLGLKLSHGQIELTAFLLRQACANGLVAPYWFQEAFSPIRDKEDLLPAMTETLQWIQEKGILRIANQYRRAMRRSVGSAFWMRLSASIDRIAPRQGLLSDMQVAAREEALRTYSYARLIKLRREETNSLSQFDAVNGITAVAREQEDATLRWRLEQLGWTFLFAQESPTEQGTRRSMRRERVRVGR